MRRALPLLLPLLLAAPGCRGMYYSAMETFGKHKRDLLVDHVEEGREEQAEAREQFLATFEAFRSLSGFDGGELEDAYERLRDELEDSEGAAERVRDRIDAIETTAADLFEEWEDELEEIRNGDLRRQSEAMLAETRGRYRDLVRAMERAAERMDPVLVAFRDHVLFLKHNLNARAVASLQNVVVEVEDDVSELIAQVEEAIREADEFLATMEE